MTTAQRFPLAVCLAAALLAFARSMSSVVGACLAVLALATPLLAIRLDPSVERLARLLARFAVVAAVFVGWALAIAPMLQGERADDIMRAIGFVLAGCALPLAVARTRVDAAVFLAVLGLFGLAGFHRMVELRPFAAVAGVAAALHVMSARVGLRRMSARRVALSLGVAGSVATLLALGLPPAQRRLERALMAGRVIELKGRSGLSNEDVRVGEVSSLAQSDRLVLRAYGPRGQRLRAQVYTRFDARVWHALHDQRPSELKETPLPVGPRARELVERMAGGLHLLPETTPEELLGDEVIATRLEPVDLDEGLFVQPGDALAVKTENEVHVDTLRLLVRFDRRQPEPFVVVHRRRIGVADPREPDPTTLALSLSLPRKVDPRVRALADQLALEAASEPCARAPGAACTAIQRTEHTRIWLQRNLRYTLETPTYGKRDLLSELLFEHRAGYCEHYATALAILLRLQGVPTRYVTGFRVDEGDREGDHYVVRDANAHAWVEAWVPGTGWLEADATPIVEERLAKRVGMRARWARLVEWFADLRAAVRYGRLVDTVLRLRWPLSIAFSALGLLYVARNEIRRRLAEARDRPRLRARDRLSPELESCVREVDAAFRRAGWPRPRSSGLREHVAAVEAGGLDRAFVEAMRDAVEVVHRAAFAGERPTASELEAARSSLRRATRV